MTFGSLFSGIGGMDLGLERAGMECVWQVENDPYCLKVLEKNFPRVDQWGDVRTFPPGPPLSTAFLFRPDLICGGFPCQPVSLAGAGKGEKDARWLWPEFERIIRLFGPSYVIVENVPGLFSRGLGLVLRDLAKAGYDAEWGVLSACSMGATHTRERVFIVGYAQSIQAWCNTGLIPAKAPDRWVPVPGKRPRAEGTPWANEPGISRTLDGVPHRMDRNKALGNAVVPQVAEWLGRYILERKSAS